MNRRDSVFALGAISLGAHPTIAHGLIIDAKAHAGAIGDGKADDTAALQAAHDALPEEGGAILIPGGKYLISSPLVFTKRVRVFGTGTLEDETAAPPCVFVKKSSMKSTLLTLSGFSTVVEGLALVGQEGNVGDGIQIKGNNITLRDVAVALMGGNGIRIGHSDITNCNDWCLINVNARRNGDAGIYVHSDDSGKLVNANAGTALNLVCHSNLGNGLHVRNGQKNTFIGLHTESNSRYGICLEGQADNNVFIGGDQEGNRAADVFISATTCNDNLLIGTGVLGAFIDLGKRTMKLETTYVGLPQINGEIAGNGPVGGSFSTGNDCYVQLYGDRTGRIRVGWAVGGPPPGQIAAQILADANTLHLASRDTVAGKIKLSSGDSLRGYLLLDHQNSRLETNEEIFTSEKIRPGTPERTFQSACGLFAGSGPPKENSGVDGDVYFRGDGENGTTIYHMRAGRWVAIA